MAKLLNKSDVSNIASKASSGAAIKLEAMLHDALGIVDLFQAGMLL